jgi:hypothetical protein
MIACVRYSCNDGIQLSSVRHRWRQSLASTHHSVKQVQWEKITGDIFYMKRMYSQ